MTLPSRHIPQIFPCITHSNVLHVFFSQTELFYSYNNTPFIEFSYKPNKIKRERVFEKIPAPWSIILFLTDLLLFSKKESFFSYNKLKKNRHWVSQYGNHKLQSLGLSASSAHCHCTWVEVVLEPPKPLDDSSSWISRSNWTGSHSKSRDVLAAHSLGVSLWVVDLGCHTHAWDIHQHHG